MAPTNPLLQAALSSARFAGRRASARLSGRRPEIETLIVDVDRTLTAEDSPKVALQNMVGKEKTKEIFDSFIAEVVRGRLRLQDLHSAVFGELYSRGFKKSDWVAVMEGIEKEGGLRESLISSILGLAEREGLTVVLATRASLDSARWLAGKYGFSHAVGSVEKVNGAFVGFETVIGAFDDGNGTMTKLTAASRVLARSGRSLDPSRTAVIANDLLDAIEMLNSALGVLIIPEEPNRLERLSAGLRLYDVLISGGDAPGSLGPALGFS
jgi:hypothetical protein